jgi:endonuclease-3
MSAKRRATPARSSRSAAGRRAAAAPAPAAPAPVAETLKRLKAAYPDARLILRFASPFQLLCATILAAQATDERVNLVTPVLFARWSTPAALAGAPLPEVEAVIRPTGFYRQKAKRLVEVAGQLVERFGGQVPEEVEALTTLPGVGKKTAILVINHAYGKPAGVAVDTHVQRVAGRLGWSAAKDADRMEEELRGLVPRREWIHLQDLLAFHGRAPCRAPKPRCTGCPVEDLCPFPEKVPNQPAGR